MQRRLRTRNWRRRLSLAHSVISPSFPIAMGFQVFLLISLRSTLRLVGCRGCSARVPAVWDGNGMHQYRCASACCCRWLVPEAGIPDSLTHLRLIRWPEFPEAAGVPVGHAVWLPPLPAMLLLISARVSCRSIRPPPRNSARTNGMKAPGCLLCISVVVGNGMSACQRAAQRRRGTHTY